MVEAADQGASGDPLIVPESLGRTLSGPEHQRVRLPVLAKLHDLGWHPGQLQWQPEWRVPKSPHDAAKREAGSSFAGWPVDLILFEDEQHAGSWEHAVIVFEFKAPSLSEGLSQLEIYLNREPRARMGYWTNGTEDVRVYRLADGTFKHLRNHGLPSPARTSLNLPRSRSPITTSGSRRPKNYAPCLSGSWTSSSPATACPPAPRPA